MSSRSVIVFQGSFRIVLQDGIILSLMNDDDDERCALAVAVCVRDGFGVLSRPRLFFQSMNAGDV